MANNDSFADIQQYFSKAEFEQLGYYDKLQYSNQKANYNEMINSGILIRPPDFMEKCNLTGSQGSKDKWENPEEIPLITPKKCAQLSPLKTHQHKHTGSKTFKCHKRQDGASTSTLLKQQRFTHFGIKPFECDQCDYKSSRSYALKVHQLSHSGIKPFKCDQCDYRASTSVQLKQHQFRHSGIKPFRCDKCDYECVRSAHLKMHQFTHSELKPFRCDKCNFRCATSGDFELHQFRHSNMRLILKPLNDTFL